MKVQIFKKYICVLFISLTLIFNSCISINRDIRLNIDGSGQEILTIKYGKEFFSTIKSFLEGLKGFDPVKVQNQIDSLYEDSKYINEMKESFNNVEGITINSINSFNEYDSSKIITVDYSFNNIQALTRELSISNSKRNIDDSKPEVNFQEDGDFVTFNYTFVPRNNANDSTSKQFQQSFANLFIDQAITFNISFPYEIIESNANTQTENTLTWRFPFDEIIYNNTQIILTAKMKK